MTRIVSLTVLVVALVGCGGPAPRTQTVDTGRLGVTRDERPTLAQIDQRCFAFADRYAVVLSSVVEDICRDEPDLRRRREAHRLRVGGISGVYDVATGSDPFSKLLDLILVVTLQSRRWIDEEAAITTFGPEKGKQVAVALRRLRLEVWELAAAALTPAQLQELDGLITTWRRANPDVSGLTFVRFDDVSASRGKALAQEVREGGGLFAPVDRAVDVAEQGRQLGERLFWLSKRAPALVQYQVELAADDVFLRPEVQNVTATVTGLPAFIVAQRQAVIADLTTMTAQVGPLLNQVQGLITGTAPVVGDVRAATALVAETAAAAERLVKLLAPPPPAPGAPPAKAFDIAEYHAALREAGATLSEANKSLTAVHSLLGGSVLTERLKEFNGAATERLEDATKRIDDVSEKLFWRALGFVAAVLIMLAGYRWFLSRLRRSAP